MLQSHEISERETMHILHGLALEFQDMDEMQRLKTLKWVVEKETSGEGNRFWLMIAKILLVRPELIPRALKLSSEQSKTIGTSAKVIDFKASVEHLASNKNAPHNKGALDSFFHIFSEA